jgi:N-acetylneuraminate synthase
MRTLMECIFDVDFLKVSSYDLLRLDFLDEIGGLSHRLPIILSTGMATLDEVQEAVEALRRGGCQDLTLLHCVSLYPTRPEEANLRAIQTLKEAFPGCKVGWSDHTGYLSVCKAAWKHYGAEVVEVHFDLGDGLGAERAHSWVPDYARLLRDDDCAAEIMVDIHGTGIKAPQPRELPERLWRADPTDGLRPLKEARKPL